MKKFMILVLAIGMMVCTGCEKSLALKYNFLVEGEAKGNVDLVFPGGELKTSGEVVLDFRYGNIEVEREFTFEEACAEKDINVRKAALQASQELEEQFSVAGGEYDLVVDAEAYEETLGIKIKFHKEFKSK